MIKPKSYHAGLFLLFFFPGILAALEGTLEYRSYEGRPEIHLPWTSPEIEFKLKPPDDVKVKFPETVSEHPVYARLQLGETQRILLFDYEKKDDGFYKLLYFDQNANNDLTDDPAIKAQSFSNGGGPYGMRYAGFENIKTTYKIGDTTLPYLLSINARWFVPSLGRTVYDPSDIVNRMTVSFSPKCYYEGQFKDYQFVLTDFNGNGYFSETLTRKKDYDPEEDSNEYDADVFVLRKDKKYTWSDEQWITGYMELAGVLYEFKPDITKGKIVVEPYSGDLTPVTFSMKTERTTLYNSSGKGSICFYGTGEEATVPAGRYNLVDYCVFKKDEKGALWLLQCNATRESPVYFINGSSKTDIAFGEPFIPYAKVPKWSLEHFLEKNDVKYVNLSLGVEGKAREELLTISKISGDETAIPMSSRSKTLPKEPTITVSDKTGEIVFQGAFEYG